MRYVCPKCGQSYTPKPAGGTCQICDAALVPESEAQEAEERGEREGLPSAKKRL